MDSSKRGSKTKRNQRKVVNIRCRKISSNRSQLLSSRATGAGYKHRIKALSKNNRELASALQDARCDLDDCKQCLTKMKCARIKMFEMHKSLKCFMKDFEEALSLLNTDESNWLVLGPSGQSQRTLKGKMKSIIEPVEEVTETESLIDEQLDLDEEPIPVQRETVDSGIIHKPSCSTTIDTTFATPTLQLEDGKELSNKTLDSTSLAASEENEDSATPKLVLSSPIVMKLTYESKSCVDLQDNVLPTPKNIPNVLIDSSVTNFPPNLRSSKIPRIDRLSKTKQGSSAHSGFGKENKLHKLISNTGSSFKICKSNLSQNKTFNKNSEIVTSNSKSSDCSDMHVSFITKNSNNAANKCESNSSQKMTFAKNPVTLVSSSMLPYDCNKVSDLKGASVEKSEDISQVLVEATSRRKTFVICETKDVEEPQTHEHNDRRKTFVKKSPKIAKRRSSVRNRRGTFVISHNKKDKIEECSNQSETNYSTISGKMENTVETAFGNNAKVVEAICYPDHSNMINNTVTTDLENCIEERSVDLPIEDILVSQTIALESNSNADRSYCVDERTTCAAIVPDEQHCSVVENIIEKESSSLELEDIIDKAFKIADKPTEIQKSEYKKVTEKTEDLRNENPNFLTVEKMLVNEVNSEEFVKTIKDLQIRIKRVDDTLAINENSTKNNDPELNKLSKNLVTVQKEIQSHKPTKVREKSTKVRKSLLVRTSPSFKDVQNKIQSEDDNSQLLENPTKKKSICIFKSKGISYIDFSSSESENESLPNIDEIIKEVPSVTHIPIRREISKFKSKRIFTFNTNRRKSVLSKKVRKSIVSKVHDNDDNQLNTDVGDIVTENVSDSSINLVENSTKQRKSVTFALNAENKTKCSQVKIPNKRKSILNKNVRKSVISKVDVDNGQLNDVYDFTTENVPGSSINLAENCTKHVNCAIEDKTNSSQVKIPNKRKSILNKNVRKSVISKVDVDNGQLNDVCNVTTENVPGSNVIQGENCTKHVNYASEDKTNSSQVKIPDKRSTLIQAQLEMTIIREENTEDIQSTYKTTVSDEIESNCSPKLNTHLKQINQFVDINTEEMHVQNSVKGKKIRKRKVDKEDSNQHPKKSKKGKAKKKAFESKSSEDIYSEDAVNNGLSNDQDIKQKSMKKITQRDVAEKNTFVVCAEVHPPPHFLQTEIPLKKKEPAQNQKRLSVKLKDIFDSESIDILRISGDKEYLKGRTSVALKDPLSNNLSNIQDTVDNKDAKSSVTFDGCEGVEEKKYGRRGKKVSYKEPSLCRKMRR